MSSVLHVVSKVACRLAETISAGIVDATLYQAHSAPKQTMPTLYRKRDQDGGHIKTSDVLLY